MNSKKIQNISDLSERKPLKFFRALAMDWLGIIGGISLFYFYPNVVTFLIASIVVGIFQHALFILAHEGVHFNICTNRTLNDWVTRTFCIFPVGMTLSSYREFHFAHHRNTKKKNDPEVEIMEKIGKHWEPPFTITRGLKLWGLSLVGGNLKDQFIMASNMPKGNSREKILLGLFTLLMFLTAYEFNQFAILGLWFYSLISTNLSTFRIETWFEHSLDTANTNRYQLPNIFFRPIVPHNIWIHYEHHKSPSIPFYNLAMARELDSSQKIMTFEEMELSLSKQWKPNDQFERAA